MIDFRYHLVSLIAVFLAVALGIIIGTTALNEPILAVNRRMGYRPQPGIWLLRRKARAPRTGPGFWQRWTDRVTRRNDSNGVLPISSRTDRDWVLACFGWSSNTNSY